jgi:hypothetical protein
MTDRTADYFTMTGAHYEDDRFAFTSTRTLPGRYGGDLIVSLPATAYQEREASRDALYALIETMPVEWAGKVERVACDLAVSEWSLALANVLRGFTRDVGDPSVIYLEPGGDMAAAETCAESAQVSKPAPLTDRTRRWVWRVTAGLAAALAAGMLIRPGVATMKGVILAGGSALAAGRFVVDRRQAPLRPIMKPMMAPTTRSTTTMVPIVPRTDRTGNRSITHLVRPPS